jgi:hypothetical protein
MSLPFESDELLIRYHLGELSPDERDAVEARYFADDLFHEQVLAVEEELIDSYLRGELSTGQRTHFEGWFLQIGERREKLEFARALAGYKRAQFHKLLGVGGENRGEVAEVPPAVIPVFSGAPERKSRWPIFAMALGAMIAVIVVAYERDAIVPRKAPVKGVKPRLAHQPPTADLPTISALIEVPAVSGMSLDAAEQTLRERHLAVGTITKESKVDAPQNRVLRQSASPGSKVEPGTPIDLIVSEIPRAIVEVPNLSGMSLVAARQALRERHLAVGSVTMEPKADAPQNTILRQSASPGSKVEAGTPIDLIVSELPGTTVEVPDLSGMSLAAARQILRQRQLDVGSITGEPKEGAVQNTILRQNRLPGSKVAKGTPIDLIVSEVPAPNP